uniref:SET104 n=1 Tax=Arundo donax TaxID=35708 RepID=A0A0A9T080_ARUDO
MAAVDPTCSKNSKLLLEAEGFAYDTMLTARHVPSFSSMSTGNNCARCTPTK